MSASRKDAITQPLNQEAESKVIHIYQVRPEMALEHLKRTTGLDFDSVPESLVYDQEAPVQPTFDEFDAEPPILTDVVDKR